MGLPVAGFWDQTPTGALFPRMCDVCPRNQKVNRGVFQALDPVPGCCFPVLLRGGPGSKPDQTLAGFSNLLLKHLNKFNAARERGGLGWSRVPDCDRPITHPVGAMSGQELSDSSSSP